MTTHAWALPDLVPEVFGVAVVVESVDPGDVIEGCAGGETDRRLLRFSLRSRNIGLDDLELGDPQCPDCSINPGVFCGNPLFECSTAHGHPHFDDFISAELLDASDAVVAVGHKQGFCLLDSECPSPQYHCGFQGISAGCADVYGSGLPCQYIDLTDVAVPDGAYTLRVTIDPTDRLAEADEANNAATTPVFIGTPPPPPPPTCPVYGASDVPLPIPDVASVTSALTVPPVTGTVERVRVVDLEGTHTFTGDLEFHLLSPAGADVLILDNACGAADDFDVDLSDSATDPVPCPMTDGGLHLPGNPLSVLQGEPPAGAWSLRVDDVAAQDVGTLTSWGLEICTTCGNGTLEVGESCDDGNNDPDDCCSADCQLPASDGTACMDGCVQGGSCLSGVCIGGAIDCGPCLVCNGDNQCAPPTGLSCHSAAAEGSNLVLKRDADPQHDALTWKWKSAVPLALLDFGSPTTVTDLTLCVYDQGGLRLSATAPAAGDCSGAPCWQAGEDVLRYVDATERTPDGLARLVLRSGAVGQAKIVAKGKGADLDMPALGFAMPLTTRMVRSGGPTCFQATFSSALEQSEGRFKARSN